MEAEKDPEYLRATADSVEEFRGAFRAFLKLHVDNPIARGVAPAVVPRSDADPEEIERLHARVARAAGRASAAVPLTRVYYMVQGRGAIDAIAAWQTVARPKPLLEPPDVLDTVEQVLGRLEAMIRKAEAETPPTIGAAAMHPLVWGAANRLWRDGHYRASIAAAADAVVGLVKSRTGRNDISETALWQEVFSSTPPAPGKPRLRWRGNPTDRDVKTMNDGLRQFAPGVQMTIRNPAAHSPEELGEQAALERLAVLSLLARWVDDCDLRQAEPD